MERLPWILGWAALASLGSVAGAGGVLLLPEGARRRVVPGLISYATGTLLAATFLAVLPEALALAPAPTVLATVLGGVVLSFALEKVVRLRHCHDPDCAEHRHAGPLLLLGDAFHNVVDGVVVAAAFLTSVPLGVSVALATIAHEVPQEVGEFAVLLDSGFSRARAFGWNLLSASATVPGALLAAWWLPGAQGLLPFLLALAAASFLYVGVADLLPGLHRRLERRGALWQVLLVLAGIATVAIAR